METADPDPPGDDGKYKIRKGGPVLERYEADKLSTFIIGKCNMDVLLLLVKPTLDSSCLPYCSISEAQHLRETSRSPPSG